jgi:hypothetical protein
MVTKFTYFLLNSRGDKSNNLNELNELLSDGWFPVRETGGTNPDPLIYTKQHVDEEGNVINKGFVPDDLIVKGDIRMWLVLLSKDFPG